MSCLSAILNSARYLSISWLLLHEPLSTPCALVTTCLALPRSSGLLTIRPCAQTFCRWEPHDERTGPRESDNKRHCLEATLSRLSQTPRIPSNNYIYILVGLSSVVELVIVVGIFLLLHLKALARDCCRQQSDLTPIHVRVYYMLNTVTTCPKPSTGFSHTGDISAQSTSNVAKLRQSKVVSFCRPKYLNCNCKTQDQTKVFKKLNYQTITHSRIGNLEQFLIVRTK